MVRQCAQSLRGARSRASRCFARAWLTETAAKSLRDLRVAEVGKLDMKVESGKVVAYRARVSLSFSTRPDSRVYAELARALAT